MMKTPTLTDTEARVLAFIRAQDGASEEQVRELLYPSPKFPPGNPSEAEKAVWLTANRAYWRLAHGQDTEYRESYCAKASAVTIALSKAGLIREHNNGFNCYHFTPIK